LQPLYFATVDRLDYFSFIIDHEFFRRDGQIGFCGPMTNHIHPLIRIGTVDPGEILRSGPMKFATYFNRTPGSVKNVMNR
jgi:hypothetical protein